jgi:hypothetical protein
MRKTGKTFTAALAPLMLIASLTSCSKGETEAVPKLPEQICWNVFPGKDISPFLPTGKSVTIDNDPFVLNESLDEPICSLYIDGNTQFQALARYQDFESGIDWSSFDPAKPERIDVGKKGIMWDDGAAAYIVCEPPKSDATPGKYIDLHIYTFGKPGDRTARKALPTLMKQFVTFAQHELNCTDAP